MAQLQKIPPLQTTSLRQALGLGMSMGHYAPAILVVWEGSRSPLEKLDERCERLNALFSDPRAPALALLSDNMDTRILVQAAIRSDDFETVATNLALAIQRKGLHTARAEAFLYYYMDHLASDPRLEATNPRLARDIARSFDDESSKISGSSTGRRLNRDEEAMILRESYRQKFEDDRPAAETFEALARDYLALPTRSLVELVKLIQERSPSE